MNGIPNKRLKSSKTKTVKTCIDNIARAKKKKKKNQWIMKHEKSQYRYVASRRSFLIETLSHHLRKSPRQCFASG